MHFTRDYISFACIVTLLFLFYDVCYLNERLHGRNVLRRSGSVSEEGAVREGEENETDLQEDNNGGEKSRGCASLQLVLWGEWRSRR